MGRAWCLLRPGGRALVGVPAGPEDLLRYNGGRTYGPAMLAHLFANWEQVHSTADYDLHYDEGCPHCYQPVFVLEKPAQ